MDPGRLLTRTKMRGIDHANRGIWYLIGCHVCSRYHGLLFKQGSVDLNRKTAQTEDDMRQVIEITPLKSAGTGIEYIPAIETIVNLTDAQKAIWHPFYFVEAYAGGWQTVRSLYCHSAEDFHALLANWNKVYNAIGFSYREYTEENGNENP